MQPNNMVFILLFGLSIVLYRLLHNLEMYWEIGVETMDIKFAEIYVNKKITRLKLTRILEVHTNFMKH